MPDPHATEAARAAARAAAAALSSSLHTVPELPVVERALGVDVIITVAVVPRCGRGAERLTPCERDVVAVLQKAVRRLTEPEVAGELDRHGLRYADVTIRRALARLVRLGYAESSKRAPRGYLLVLPPAVANPA
jgi:hypothetical protein